MKIEILSGVYPVIEGSAYLFQREEQFYYFYMPSDDLGYVFIYERNVYTRCSSYRCVVRWYNVTFSVDT